VGCGGVGGISLYKCTNILNAILVGDLAVVKHSTANPGIASLIPLTPIKITERRYVLVLPRKNAPVYQCFTLGTLKNLVCHLWWEL